MDEVIMVLVFASNNAHKLTEVREIMPAGIEVLSLRDIGFEQEIDETGTTLAENSMIKARTVADFINKGLMNEGLKIDGVFADDTGLEIDALHGEPGVYTARWYRMEGEQLKVNGEKEVFAANRAKALRKLTGIEDRGAQFKTVITLICHDDAIQVEGIVRGQITTEEYGEGGFGYDPIFIPEGYDQTFGELSPDIKNSISHRSCALHALVEKLKIY